MNRLARKGYGSRAGRKESCGGESSLGRARGLTRKRKTRVRREGERGKGVHH